MATAIFLAISAALWLPYGLFLMVNPGYLADPAGVAASSTTGSIELRAMYGGLQAGIGALALAAIWRASLRRPALICIGVLCAGLFLARMLGVALDTELSSYTIMALGFESVSVGYAAVALRQIEPSPA